MVNAKVLACDDDEVLLELISFRLAAKGYEVATASDGEMALKVAAAEAPTVIVLDAMMPRTDGFAALSRLKADPKLADIPVLMLTARRSERDIVSALERGADDYLAKPFIPEELLARVAKLVARAMRKQSP